MNPRSKTWLSTPEEVDQLVISCIRKSGYVRRRDIKSFLAQNHIEYADHKGLDFKLESMIKRKLIKKISKTEVMKFPTYQLTKKSIDKLGIDPYLFNHVATFRFIRSYFDIITKDQTGEEFLNGLINRVGAYVMFCYLKSWKLISKKNTPEENAELRRNWAANAISLKGVIGNFDGFIGHSHYLKNKKRFERMTKEEYKKNKLEFSPKQAKKLEKLLLQKNPELEQVEDTWKRFEANDWKSIHFDAVDGTVSFLKEPRRRNIK